MTYGRGLTPRSGPYQALFTDSRSVDSERSIGLNGPESSPLIRAEFTPLIRSVNSLRCAV
jgi:hypothetical protein